MKRTTTILSNKKISNLLKMDYANINNLKMLTNELDLEDIKYLRDKLNEKRELIKVSTIIKDYVEELKSGIKDNYDKPKEMNKFLKYKSINLYSKNLKINDNIPFLKPKKTTESNSPKRKNLSIDEPISILKNKSSVKKVPSTFSNYKIKIIESEIDKKSVKSKQSLISKKSGVSKSSMKSKKKGYSNNKMIDDIFNRKLTEKKFLQLEFDKKRNNFLKDEDKSFGKLNVIKGFQRFKTEKKNLNNFNSNIKFVDNQSENGYDSDKNNELLIKRTKINNDGLLKLNDLKKEIKNTFIGDTLIKFKDNQKFLVEDTPNIMKSTIVKNPIYEDDDIDFKEERYRNLQKKGYVYDSLDDEEIIEDQVNLFYISPDSPYAILMDFLVCICAFFYIIYIPIFLASNDFYCKNNFFDWDTIIELFIDFIYICDCIVPFFVAFYNFDEILNTDLRVIARHYMNNWFFCDIIAALPIKTLLSLTDRKCKSKTFMNAPLYHNNLYYLLICIRIIKLYKVICKNRFLDEVSNILNEINHFSDYLKIYSNLITFLIALHIVSNIFLFIGKNDYPNWIINYGYEDLSYLQLYLISVYYSIETLTTVGYGDIVCVTPREKVFGLFMECIGIFAYSWIITSISNYVKVLNEKTEQYENKVKILDSIKLSCTKFPEDLYERITRYLKYKQDEEKLDKKIIFESLPLGLTNLLIYEMYKPIINNFVFFKNFDNIDFIVKVILNFNPILSVRNDILIKEGDFVEEIIFIKRGRLSLELPLDFNNKPTNIIEDVTLNNPSLFIKTQLSKKINPKIKKKRFRRFLAKFKRRKKRYSLLDDINSFQMYKILELRRNEHFGDILMFLNQRSPLNLRVKTKKAELYFLNKKDVLDISTCFPSIWKQIIKKSLFNYEQIKRLMNKIKKIFISAHGKNINNNNKLNHQLSKKFKNSEIEQAELNESELKSIPSFTDLTESILNNINEKDSSSKSSESESSNSVLKKNTISNQHISEKSDEQSSSSFVDKNSVDSKISKNSSNSKISKNSNNSKISQNSSNSKISKNSSNSKITKNTKLSKNTKISKITKNNKMNSKISYDLNAHRNLDYPIIKNTPFLPDDINDEIYPNETFFNGDLNEENKFKRNKTKDLKKRIKKEYNTYKTSIKTYENDNNTKINIDTSILNISICSTEISFTLNSEYDNINELSDYKYTKDKKLRERISNILKGREELISKSNSSSSDSDKKKTNKDSKKKDDLMKFKIPDEKKRRQSISFFQTPPKFSTPIVKKYTTNNEKVNHKNIKSLSKKDIRIKSNKENGGPKTRRQSLLITLNQNIERNQINLNNPDLFYQEYFQRIIEENKGKDKDIENLAKNNTKIKSQKSLQNFNINFNKIINQGQT